VPIYSFFFKNFGEKKGFCDEKVTGIDKKAIAVTSDLMPLIRTTFTREAINLNCYLVRVSAIKEPASLEKMQLE
jgi:hypothetical protein